MLHTALRYAILHERAAITVKICFSQLLRHYVTFSLIRHTYATCHMLPLSSHYAAAAAFAYAALRYFRTCCISFHDLRRHGCWLLISHYIVVAMPLIVAIRCLPCRLWLRFLRLRHIHYYFAIRPFHWLRHTPLRLPRFFRHIDTFRFRCCHYSMITFSYWLRRHSSLYWCSLPLIAITPPLSARPLRHRLSHITPFTTPATLTLLMASHVISPCLRHCWLFFFIIIAANIATDGCCCLHDAIAIAAIAAADAATLMLRQPIISRQIRCHCCCRHGWFITSCRLMAIDMPLRHAFDTPHTTLTQLLYCCHFSHWWLCRFIIAIFAILLRQRHAAFICCH